MAEPFPDEPREAYAGGPEGPMYEPELGVMEALGMGWRLLMADFWTLWLPAFVMVIILLGAGLVGSVIPFGGGACVNLLVGFFVTPAFLAGIVRAATAQIDGERAAVGHVFDGFRHRYWQAVVGWLPINVVGLVSQIIVFVAMTVALGGMRFLTGGGQPTEEEVLRMLAVLGMVGLPVMAASFIFSLFFFFVMPAVWDHPGAYWGPIRLSAQLVKDRFLPMLGLGLVTTGIWIAGAFAGVVACCVGLLFTMPFIGAWFAATTVYLYRSWTGQPLEQEPQEYGVPADYGEYGREVWPPEGEAYGPEGGPPPPGEGPGREPPGPVPPSDVYPPDRR